MGVKKLPFKEFKEIYSKVPRLAVDVVIKTPEGIVLSRRSIEPYKNMWHIPGGTLLLGESVEEAVVRVAKEETGLDVGIDKYLGYLQFNDMKENGGFGQAVSLAFLTFVEGGKIEKDGNATDIGIFKNIPKEIVDEHAKLLKDKLSMQK